MLLGQLLLMPEMNCAGASMTLVYSNQRFVRLKPSTICVAMMPGFATPGRSVFLK